MTLIVVIQATTSSKLARITVLKFLLLLSRPPGPPAVPGVLTYRTDEILVSADRG